MESSAGRGLLKIPINPNQNKQEHIISFTDIIESNQLTDKTCQVCQNSISPTESGRYCFLHRQVYDGLKAEFDAMRKTTKGSNLDWNKLLSEKRKSEHHLPKELGDVIRIELDSTLV